MKKPILILLTAISLITLVLAANNAAKSSLYLYPIDQTTQEPIKGDAWAKMAYDENALTLKAHGLTPNARYTLIRYTGPLPGSPITCLVGGTTNNGGNLNLKSALRTGGPNILLAPSSDIQCPGTMTNWRPGEYLFGQSQI